MKYPSDSLFPVYGDIALPYSLYPVWLWLRGGLEGIYFKFYKIGWNILCSRRVLVQRDNIRMKKIEKFKFVSYICKDLPKKNTKCCAFLYLWLCCTYKTYRNTHTCVWYTEPEPLKNKWNTIQYNIICNVSARGLHGVKIFIPVAFSLHRPHT